MRFQSSRVDSRLRAQEGSLPMGGLAGRLGLLTLLEPPKIVGARAVWLERCGVSKVEDAIGDVSKVEGAIGDSPA